MNGYVHRDFFAYEHAPDEGWEVEVQVVVAANRLTLSPTPPPYTPQ